MDTVSLSLATEQTNDSAQSSTRKGKAHQYWLGVELERFEQQLERGNTKVPRRRIALLRGLYAEAQRRVKQLERNARAVFGSTAADIPSPPDRPLPPGRDRGRRRTRQGGEQLSCPARNELATSTAAECENAGTKRAAGGWNRQPPVLRMVSHAAPTRSPAGRTLALRRSRDATILCRLDWPF